MIFTVVFPEESQSAANTLLQLYAANSARPLEILSIVATMNGIDNVGTPILFEFCTQTSAGTGGTSVTPSKTTTMDPHSIEATCLRKPTGSNWTGQPTTTDIIEARYGHPQTGFDWVAGVDGEIKIQGGTRFGLRLPSAPAAAVNMSITIKARE